jgi:hypothetical protein
MPEIIIDKQDETKCGKECKGLTFLDPTNPQKICAIFDALLKNNGLRCLECLNFTET